MKLADLDSKKVLPLLDSLTAAIEEILLAGLTAASQATHKTLGVSFQEASRMRLLRLGATLRVANEEIGRFTRNDAEFSKQRLSFFLGRAWLLSRGLATAVRNTDSALFERLMHTPVSQPLKQTRVITLGVTKKHVKDSFCGFDFRLRTLDDTPQLPRGQSLVWSCVFPLKPGNEIPPEGFLHLPQKQKFKPHLFLEGKIVEITSAMFALDDHGGGRLTMGEKTSVTAAKTYSDWPQHFAWDPSRAQQHLQQYRPGPFDLEIDLQEELMLDVWQFAEDSWQPATRKTQQLVPIVSHQTLFQLSYSDSPEGVSVKSALKKLHAKKDRPPLFGLMHYAACQLMVQPLTLLEGEKPRYLTISDKDVDRKALLAALKF
ncbi:hypothetical protein [Aeoliella mucimassa]|uniref:Uncharacterized protein n=1 Tax=Aeoliella mucimassa TaxID=2527972 RepID=A0A518ALW8_9BACT|nr:hypothetical protein [Aeoliella mucimassa]QDU55714.1 hypothetical protein Pan181_19080 [Aeoliella mucimassa]